MAFLYSVYGYTNDIKKKLNKPNDYENDFKIAKLST